MIAAVVWETELNSLFHQIFEEIQHLFHVKHRTRYWECLVRKYPLPEKKNHDAGRDDWRASLNSCY